MDHLMTMICLGTSLKPALSYDLYFQKPGLRWELGMPAMFVIFDFGVKGYGVRNPRPDIPISGTWGRNLQR